jgi:hypothetical protein
MSLICDGEGGGVRQIATGRERDEAGHAESAKLYPYHRVARQDCVFLAPLFGQQEQGHAAMQIMQCQLSCGKDRAAVANHLFSVKPV